VNYLPCIKGKCKDFFYLATEDTEDRGRKTEDGRQETVETTSNQKLFRGVQMLHGAVFSKRAPLVWPPEV